MSKEQLEELIKERNDYPSLNFLLGEILTIIDAVSEDKERKKAVKDLVRNAFSRSRSSYERVYLEKDGVIYKTDGSTITTGNQAKK